MIMNSIKKTLFSKTIKNIEVIPYFSSFFSEVKWADYLITLLNYKANLNNDNLNYRPV